MIGHRVRIVFLAILVATTTSTVSATPVSSPTPQDRSKDESTFKDPVFNFRLKKADSRNWSFSTPSKKHGSLRLQLQHLIGGKKDLIRLTFHAWDAKKTKQSESVIFGQLSTSVKQQFSEIREEDTKEKDRFGRYKTVSYHVLGRLSKDKTKIQHMKLHVFKHKNHIYAILILHAPKMDEKYAEDLKFIEKNFRAA